MAEDIERRVAMLEATVHTQEKQYAQLHADFRTMTNALTSLTTSVGVLTSEVKSLGNLSARVDQNTVAEAITRALREDDARDDKKARENIAIGATIAGILAGVIVSVAQMVLSGG